MAEEQHPDEVRDNVSEELSDKIKAPREELERETRERHAPPDEDPHHDLANPVGEPDPTEWPDPFETRPDPRDPAAVDTPAMPAERDPSDEPPQDPSTSDPHPPRNRDELRRGVDR
jgi:hypothetical protein